MLSEEKAQLLDELDSSFSAWKQNVKFSASLDDLDDIFFIKDFVLSTGFVSPQINRMICSRIRDTFDSWVRTIHSWLVPTPYSIISEVENSQLTDDDREKLRNALHDFMSIITLNVVVGISKDSQKEAAFVDEGLKVWKKHVGLLTNTMQRIQTAWKTSDQL